MEGMKMENNFSTLMLLTKPPAQLALQLLTPIMWSRFILILCLIHSAIARPQGQVDTLTSFFPENHLEETSGTQLITPGDPSSDSNLATQPPWTEDPKPILFAGTGCNNASPSQIPHSQSRRSFTKRGEEMCSPDDRNQFFKQPQIGRQPVRDAAQPLPLNPTSVNPQRPVKIEKPPRGVHPGAYSMYLAIYNFPGMDGQPDDQVCATSQNPLLRVPICAPPQPYTPLPFVLPARFWQSSDGCDKALDEDLWCCLVARQPFHELYSISSGPPPSMIQAYPAVGFTCEMLV